LHNRLLVNFRSSFKSQFVLDLQNITTIYKDNNIKYQHIYKHQDY